MKQTFLFQGINFLWKLFCWQQNLDFFNQKGGMHNLGLVLNEKIYQKHGLETYDEVFSKNKVTNEILLELEKQEIYFFVHEKISPYPYPIFCFFVLENNNQLLISEKFLKNNFKNNVVYENFLEILFSQKNRDRLNNKFKIKLKNSISDYDS